MDDEEDEQLPRCFGTLTNTSSSNNDGPTDHTNARLKERSSQTIRLLCREREMAPFQGTQRDAPSPCGDVEANTPFRAHWGGNGRLASLSLASGVLEGPRALFHGNAGFRAHFPALFEHAPDCFQNPERRGQSENRPELKEDDDDDGVSVEVQIGRKLREMGDQFQQEHLQMFTHRGHFGWFHLVTSVCNFLFPQQQQQNARGQR